MIAYHFPPLAGSSGIQRTLRFAQQLPDFGWQPVVMTVHRRAYERTSDDLLQELPRDLAVVRTFAFNAARDFSIRDRYPAMLARPDRWISWKLTAVPAGLRLIRESRINAIWSTYPIATAHVIGAALQQGSKLPWLADFRDPMAQEGYPPEPKTWRSFKDIESRALHAARFSIFTTPGAARVYQKNYPEARERITVVENGYDEQTFAELERSSVDRTPLTPGAITLLHSGIVYPSERDPTCLFSALGQLAASGKVRPGELRMRFRAPVHDTLLKSMARQFGVEPYIEVLPPLPYREALLEMMRADGLLVLQAANCNEQIPAKIYEYLRCGRPVLGLTDHEGDTATVLRDAGLDTVASLSSIQEIMNTLSVFIRAVRDGHAPLPRHDAVLAASRRRRTRGLADLLERALLTSPAQHDGTRRQP
jgi:glycosyltransferase involved in cell wall biosynthesis